jgi:hypothetical protein
MFRALLRTATKICDNEKAAYSFLNMIGACVLHLAFAVAVKDALLLVSPLTFLTLTQAYVDGCAARQRASSAPLAVPIPALLPPAEPGVPMPIGG